VNTVTPSFNTIAGQMTENILALDMICITLFGRHTIHPVLSGTVPVSRLCPGQSTKKSRLRIQSANIVPHLVHQLPFR